MSAVSLFAVLGLLGCAAPKQAGMPAPGWKPVPVVAESAQTSRPSAPTAASNAQSRRVLVVINTSSAASLEIGEYYVRARAIPGENIVRINVSATETVTTDEYKFGIEAPVKSALARNKNPIDFIVTTKGVPLRIRDGNGYSVDGHLMTMNRNMTPIPETIQLAPNEEAFRKAIERSISPYFESRAPFSSKTFGFYLACRLDGYDVAHAKALVDRALKAKPEKGPFFFDEAGNRKSGSYLDMQKTLGRAHEILKGRGFQSTLDTADPFVAPAAPLAGYASWGSNDGKFDLAAYRKLSFKPGALVETFVSTSGRTFSRTEGGQSLIADLVEQGVTGVKGYVSEPYTFSLARPDVLFDRYVSGRNLAEAFWAASPILKWKDIVIGDPLCAPYAGSPSADKR